MVGFCSSTVSSCVQGFQLIHGANAIGFSCISKRFAFLNHWIYHWLVGFCSPLQIALSNGPSYLGACCKWWQGRLPTCGTEPDAGLDGFFWQNIRGQGLCNRVVKTQSDQHIQSSLRAPIAEWILVIVHFKVHRLDQRQHYAIPTILTGDIVLTTSCNYLGGKFLATYGDINCQNPSISQRLEPTSQTVETFVGSTVVLILVVFMVFRTRLPPVRSRALTGSFNCPAKDTDVWPRVFESRQLRKWPYQKASLKSGEILQGVFQNILGIIWHLQSHQMKLKGCNHQSPISPVFRGIKCCPIFQIFSHEFINLLPSPCPQPGIGLFSLKEPRSVGNGGAGGCTCFGCILDKMGNINLATNHWTTVIVGDILLVIYCWTNKNLRISRGLKWTWILPGKGSANWNWRMAIKLFTCFFQHGAEAPELLTPVDRTSTCIHGPAMAQTCWGNSSLRISTDHKVQLKDSRTGTSTARTRLWRKKGFKCQRCKVMASATSFWIEPLINPDVLSTWCACKTLFQQSGWWAHSAEVRISRFRLSSFARSVKLWWVQTSIMYHHHSPNGFSILSKG